MTLAKTCTVLFKGSKRGVVGSRMIFNNFFEDTGDNPTTQQNRFLVGCSYVKQPEKQILDPQTPFFLLFSLENGYAALIYRH